MTKAALERDAAKLRSHAGIASLGIPVLRGSKARQLAQCSDGRQDTWHQARFERRHRIGGDCFPFRAGIHDVEQSVNSVVPNTLGFCDAIEQQEQVAKQLECLSQQNFLFLLAQHAYHRFERRLQCSKLFVEVGIQAQHLAVIRDRAFRMSSGGSFDFF